MESKYAQKYDELARPYEKRMKICKVVTIVFWIIEIILASLLLEHIVDKRFVVFVMVIALVFYFVFSLQVTFKTRMNIFKNKSTSDMIREYIEEAQLDEQDVLEMDTILSDMENGIYSGCITGVKFTFTDTLLVSCTDIGEYGQSIEVARASTVKTVKVHHFTKDFRGYSFDMSDIFSLDFDSDDQSVYDEVVGLIKTHYPDAIIEHLPDEE